MLGTFFKPEFINVNLESADKDELFEEMVELFVRGGAQIDRINVLDALSTRESKMTTGIMPGIAFPHAICSGVKSDLCAIGVSRSGIEYGALDGNPVHLVFMLLLAEDSTSHHLEIMQSLSLILKKEGARETLMNMQSPKDLFDALCKFEEELN